MINIFIPTDFSAHAAAALQLSIEFVKKNGGTLHLAHGFSPGDELIADMAAPFQGVPGSMSAEQVNSFIQDRVQSIKENLATLKKETEAKGVTVETHLLEVGNMEGISEKADSLDCQLVVMGSKGAHGLGEKLIGSNAQRFIRYSKIPVLVCKSERQGASMYNVAFCSNFKNEGEKAIYSKYRDLFSKFPLHTHFLYVNTPGRFEPSPVSQEKMHDFLKDTWPSSYETHVYNDYSIEEGILNFAETHDIDMIVMATHGNVGLKRVFTPSTTESIINHSNIPVLSFNLQKG